MGGQAPPTFLGPPGGQEHHRNNLSPEPQGWEWSDLPRSTPFRRGVVGPQQLLRAHQPPEADREGPRHGL
eukprot:8213103-Pyramimonas_sp.AAC.1